MYSTNHTQQVTVINDRSSEGLADANIRIGDMTGQITDLEIKLEAMYRVMVEQGVDPKLFDAKIEEVFKCAFVLIVILPEHLKTTVKINAPAVKQRLKIVEDKDHRQPLSNIVIVFLLQSISVRAPVGRTVIGTRWIKSTFSIITISDLPISVLITLRRISSIFSFKGPVSIAFALSKAPEAA